MLLQLSNVLWIITGIEGEKVLCYMDDLVIFSASLQQYIERLKEVFDIFKKPYLKLQPDKCDFLKKDVAYLGHIVTKDVVKPNSEKIRAVKDFPIPKNPKDIKSLLGLAGYYRRFIKTLQK